MHKSFSSRADARKGCKLYLVHMPQMELKEMMQPAECRQQLYQHIHQKQRTRVTLGL